MLMDKTKNAVYAWMNPSTSRIRLKRSSENFIFSAKFAHHHSKIAPSDPAMT